MKSRFFALLTLLAIAIPATFAVAAFKAGDAVQVREGDQWSDAKLQKIEGRKYQVKYADGTEEWVNVDRLREPGAASSSTPAEAPKPATPNRAAVSLDGPFTEVQLRQVKGVEKRATAPIAAKPTTKPAAAFTDLTPTSGLSLDRVEELLICPEAPTVAIAIGARKDQDTPILVLDTLNPEKTESRVFSAKEHRVMTVGDSGRLVLSKPTKWGSNTLHLWEYVDGEYRLKTNFNFTTDGKNKDPEWARLFGSARMLVRSGFGETYLVDLKTNRQTGYIQCGDIKIHASGQYLLTTKDQSNLLLRPTDLAIIAELPSGPSKFCVDPTGTLIAAENGRKITVSKIANKTKVSETEGVGARGDFELVGNNMLLVNGSTCYDLKTGVPVWNYKAPNSKSLMLANGQMLYVGSNKGQSHACMASLPDASASSALTDSSPDKFALSPGARIKIEGDLGPSGDAAEARKVLTTALTNAGHIVDDAASKYKLTISIAPGETGKFSVRELPMGGPPVIREVDAPSTMVNASLTLDGQEIWKTSRKFSAQVAIMRKRDESLEQAVANAGKASPGQLGSLDIPSYLVKGKGAGTLGESTLTPAGFVTDSGK